LLRFIDFFFFSSFLFFKKKLPFKQYNTFSFIFQKKKEIPEDQLKIQEGDQLVSVFHYHKEAHSSFGTPFFFLLKKVSIFIIILILDIFGTKS